MENYVDVILPLPLASFYTYTVPDEMTGKIRVGSRVIVPFGSMRYYTAIVIKVHTDAPQGCEMKRIIEVLDECPVLLPRQLILWRWISDYYLCTLGDVYKAAVPSGMKLESETFVSFNPDFREEMDLAEKERSVLNLLKNGKGQSVRQLEKAGGMKNLLRVVRSLLEKKAVFIKEEFKRSYKPKSEIYVRLSESVQGEVAFDNMLKKLSRSPKQEAVLKKYLELSGYSNKIKEPLEVSRSSLMLESGASLSILKALQERGILEKYEKEVGRLPASIEDTGELHLLSSAQQQAFNAILSCFGKKDVCLLHGVTSSGKTEIYMHLAAQVLKSGKQVLYLLPEIALTTQITERLRRVFGNRLGVYHSKMPDSERVEIWQKQLSESDFDIILGARSSIFLPYRRLGLVIVDEEHETSYKQQEPAPRYHARNAAMILASMYGAKTLLGTATPSIESYYHAVNGKYGWVELTERHRNVLLPLIEPVDIKELKHKKQMKGMFSPLLLQKMHEALEQKEQVILFQNRRGFAPVMECHVCGWIPKCRHCDVSLTYHKELHRLVCHYCGYSEPVPKWCPSCEEKDLRGRGFGTEKVEDEVRIYFPNARVSRMDLDTTRTRNAYEKVIGSFEKGEIDILIGTQMISKGLDFDRVRVVGVLDADTMLNYPDFRSYERAFQLMAQVAGRAGRRAGQGYVILQTKSPDLPVIQYVLRNDYRALYRDQLTERRLFKYPPFYRLIYVYLKHRLPELVECAAENMATSLRKSLGDRVLGPDKPPVSRIQTLYIRKIMIKVEQKASMSKVSRYLQFVQSCMLADERFRSLQIYYDVDPM